MCTLGRLSLSASCVGVSGCRGSVRVSSLGGYCTGVPAIGEEPPAPSLNSTPHAFKSL
jgi:hypothetical protein